MLRYDNACLSLTHARESRLNVQDIEICYAPHDRTMSIVFLITNFVILNVGVECVNENHPPPLEPKISS